MTAIRPPELGVPLLVFDLDGTVLDSLPATFRAFQDAVAPFLGRVPLAAEVLERFGPADHEIVASWVGPQHAAQAVERLYQAYATAWGEVRAFAGMPALLDRLRGDGRRLALFTGRGRPSTETLLRAVGMEGTFEITVTGEEAARPKPAPDGLLLVLTRAGVAAGDAAYVGDTWKDMAAARGAGMTAVAALWGSPEADDLRRAEGVLAVDGVADLERLLRGGRSAGGEAPPGQDSEAQASG